LIQWSDVMSRLVMKCCGERLLDVFLPEFELSVGQVLTIQLPTHFNDETLVDVLTGRKKSTYLEIFGRVRFASVSSLDSQAGFLDRLHLRFYSPRVLDQFTRHSNITAERALAIMSSLGIEPGRRINQLPGNPRLRLALQLAFADASDVVVFNTGGCDPCGVLQAYEDIASYLPRGAAIEICSPLLGVGGQIARKPGFPGAHLVELQPSNSVATCRHKEAI